MNRIMKAHTLQTGQPDKEGRVEKYPAVWCWAAYRQMTLKRITQWKWKMLAMPSAKHRITQSTPVLWQSWSVQADT